MAFSETSSNSYRERRLPSQRGVRRRSGFMKPVLAEYGMTGVSPPTRSSEHKLLVPPLENKPPDRVVSHNFYTTTPDIPEPLPTNVFVEEDLSLVAD